MPKYHRLTLSQRAQIASLLAVGISQRQIAKMIGTAPSTICKELQKNGGAKSYNYKRAQARAAQELQRLHRPRKYKGDLRRLVREYLARDWSPKQIAGYLRRNGTAVSHETIYADIRADRQTGGKLYLHTRHKMKHRSRTLEPKNYAIPDRLDISKRPPEADGTRFGDWEVDLIVGPENKGAILTLVERSTNYALAAVLPKGKNPDGVAEAMIRLLLPFKGSVLTITADNGKEFIKHKEVTRRIGANVYFARPYHSWEKGAVENYNGLLRQYLPKKKDLRTVAPSELLEYQRLINARPRQKLGYHSPTELFYKKLKKIVSQKN